MPEINKDLLLHRILHSGDFTALEKRYLEGLVKAPRGSMVNGSKASWMVTAIIAACAVSGRSILRPHTTVVTAARR